MSQIQTKFLKDLAVTTAKIDADAVTEAKIKLGNQGALRARNAADTADVDLLKLDGSNKLQLLVMPEVSADASSANQLVRKSQLDAEIAGAAGDITALEGRVTAIENDYGVAGGLATLDVAGLVPTSQLPSYVDDVLEFPNLAAFPATGESGKIYVAIDTSKCYRWSGSVYIQITSGAVDSVNGQTGVVVLDTEDVLESGDSRYYTAARQTAAEAYADAAVLVEKNRAEAEEATLLKLDGTRPMTGDLNLGQKFVTNTKEVQVFNSANLNQFSLAKPTEVSTTDLSAGQFSRIESGQVIQSAAGKAGVLQANSLTFTNEGGISATAGDLSLGASGSILALSDVSVENHKLLNVQSVERASGDLSIIASGGNIKLGSSTQSESPIYVADSIASPNLSSNLQASMLDLVDLGNHYETNLGPNSIGLVDSTIGSESSLSLDSSGIYSDVSALVQVFAGDLTLQASGQVKVAAPLSMQTHKIVDLVDGSVSSDAATYGQVSTVAGDLATETARAIAAEGALASRATALEAASLQWQPVEKFTLTAPMIAAGYVELSFLAVEHSIMASVDRLMIHHTDDYTVSVVGGKTRLTFVGSLITPGQESLSAGDVIRVQACKVAIV